VKHLELLRTENTFEYTIGLLRESITEIELSRTMEDAWRDNVQNVSCIPEGVYQVKRYYSPTYRECFKIQDVPGRSNILIHAGNYHEDTQGCVLLGDKVAYNGDRRMVTSSRDEIAEFMKHMEGIDEFTLTIRRV